MGQYFQNIYLTITIGRILYRVNIYFYAIKSYEKN